MKDLKQKLMIEQLDTKLQKFAPLLHHPVPEKGWLTSIRTTLKMSLRQFGDRMKITPQASEGIEKREREKSITLKSLEEAGRALDMKLVYGFVPMDGSLEKMIERKTKELAIEIVQTTSDTMALEDQKNSPKRLQVAIKEKTFELRYRMPRYLWD